jgi:hypothetical protein
MPEGGREKREKKECMLVRQTVFKYYPKNRGRKTANEDGHSFIHITLKFSDN